jgi:hypothetical protein
MFQQEGVSLLLPVLLNVTETLTVLEIGRLHGTCQQVSGSLALLRSVVLERRGNASWSWQKAHSVEAAALYDPLNTLQPWTRGPNARNGCDVIEAKDDALWLSGGTDWQGFQGAFRCVSDQGVRASWISFRVRIATPDVSGAFFSLYGSKRNWGFTDPVLVFNYRGEATEQDHCFSLQTEFDESVQKRHVSQRLDVAGNRSFEIAINLNWEHRTASMFVDGVPHVSTVPFHGTSSIRYATLYNWRSSARTAFAELTIGKACHSAGLLKAARSLQLQRRPSATSRSLSQTLGFFAVWLGSTCQ